MRTPEVNQEMLDSTQYTSTSILHYETVFGEDFVSPGGREMATELIEVLELPPQSTVLDVGCGLGGSAFLMAEQFDLLVEGIDLSLNMLAMGQQKLRAYGLEETVKLEHGDCLELDKTNYYDGIYSRDVFLHIHDKPRLFSVLRTTMRNKGKLLFTDYCCGEKPWTKDFHDYVDDRGYHLRTVSEYEKLILEAGFTAVTSQDMTHRFIEILNNDLEKISKLNIDESTRKNLQTSWEAKLKRSEAGDQRWGMFTAVK